MRKIKRDRYTKRAHDNIVVSKMVVPRGPLLERMSVCRVELYIFGYITSRENATIKRRIAMQRLTKGEK